MNFPPPTKKQARILWFSLTALAIAILVMLIGLFFWGLGWVLHRLSSVLLPMGVAMILAYILDPVVEFFGRKRIPRLWSVCLVFTLGILLAAALLGSVLPGMVRESRKLADDLPNLVERGQAKVERFLENSPLARLLPATWMASFRPVKSIEPPPANNGTNVVEPLLLPQTNAAPEVLANSTNTPPSTGRADALEPDLPLGEKMMPAVTKAMVVGLKWITQQLSKISTVAEFLIGMLLVPIYLFYFLLEKQGITRQWTDYLPLHESAAKDELVFILKSINECMIVFFRGQVLVALCVGVLLTAGYSAMGLNYALLLGIVAGVLGIVPYLGTITSLILALTVAAIQFGDWAHPVIVLAIAGTVKLLEDFIISPKIIGERSGLHPLTIILAVLIGTTLFGGFLGAMLAIPLTAALRTLMFRYVWIRGNAAGKLSELEELEETER